MKLYAYPHASYRNRILYPLQLGPPFPNDVRLLKPKVGKERPSETLECAYAYTHMRMHAQALHTHALCMCA